MCLASPDHHTSLLRRNPPYSSLTSTPSSTPTFPSALPKTIPSRFLAFAFFLDRPGRKTRCAHIKACCRKLETKSSHRPRKQKHNRLKGQVVLFNRVSLSRPILRLQNTFLKAFLRTSLVSVKSFACNSRAGNGCAYFMGAWDFWVLSARETLHAHNIPCFRGAGYFGFFGGRGKCRFYFYGRRDFSEGISEPALTKARLPKRSAKLRL